MKKLFSIFAFLSIFLVLFSCKYTSDNNVSPIKQDDAEKSVLDYQTTKNTLFTSLKELQKNSIVSRNGEATDLFADEESQQIALENSIAVLHSKEITDEMIIEEFGSLTNPEIIPTALAVTRITDETEAGYWVIDVETGFCYSTGNYYNPNGQRGPGDSIVDCAMEALGVPASLIVGAAEGSLTREALLKAARKLAKRTLGWIGVAIAVYEFGDCMGWW
jgi:hypothetical protein